MAGITKNEDGSIDMLVHLDPIQVAILEYSYVEIDSTVFDSVEEASVGQAYLRLLATAKSFYADEYELGDNDGSIFLDDNAVVEYYMNHPDTETAKEAVARQQLEDEAAAAELAAARAELEAAQALGE